MDKNENTIDPFTDRVIETLETARIKAGITQPEVIQKSGIRRSTYFRKLRGDTDFTTSDINAIADALNLDPMLVLLEASEDSPSEDELFAKAMHDAKLDPMALAAYRSADKNKRPERLADEGA